LTSLEAPPAVVGAQEGALLRLDQGVDDLGSDGAKATPIRPSVPFGTPSSSVSFVQVSPPS
jgi:hypothetical protein